MYTSPSAPSISLPRFFLFLSIVPSYSFPLFLPFFAFVPSCCLPSLFLLLFRLYSSSKVCSLSYLKLSHIWLPPCCEVCSSFLQLTLAYIRKSPILYLKSPRVGLIEPHRLGLPPPPPFPPLPRGVVRPHVSTS